MAKQTIPKPNAVASAASTASAPGTPPADTTIEGASASAQGTPMPPALGNGGMAAAGEGQPSLANQVAEDQAALLGAIPAPDVKATPDAAPQPTVIVVGPKKGRWRIGRKFGPAPVTVPLSELTEADLQALENDPALSITTVTAPY